ncbi:RNA-directed RNA polymerase [Hortaea werneckii]|nr:RNA-directed RNA polymerase [Hortaea werneckii]
MDIFVRNVPPQATNRQLERLFKGLLEECGTTTFHVEKFGGKQSAKLTILDIATGRVFLQHFGVPQGSPLRVRAERPLQLHGKYLQCSPSRDPTSDFSLKSLELEAKQQRANTAVASRDAKPIQKSKITRFDISLIQCGTWDYSGTKLAFLSHWSGSTRGSITIGDREVALLLGTPGLDQKRIDFNLYSCENIVIGGSYTDPSLSFTLRFAPKFYRISSILDLDNLSAGMTALVLGPAAACTKSGKKSRLLSIDDAHAKVASTCFVYRVQLTDSSMLGTVRSLIGNNPRKPPNVTMNTGAVCPSETLGRSKVRLDIALRDVKDFKLRFQIERLARNGLQSPLRVLELLPKIRQLEAEYGLNATLYALKQFSKQAPYPGPDTEAFEVSRQSNEQLLEHHADRYNPLSPDNPYEMAKRHSHVTLVHRIVVTPVGTYLEGPEPEPANRVLRSCHGHSDHFARTVFQDEDGGCVRYDPRANQDSVYRCRFKQFLDRTQFLNGLAFSFLGFSHSSLRSQSCWSMAPFVLEGRMLLASKMIEMLGEFHHIRSPAKCAARIGQCFTDTAASVTLSRDLVDSLPVVERNGRDFSDGVGTISEDLLEQVLKVYGTRSLLKPTALQIRFQGAKGMVSLDSRLQGSQLRLRSNMKKFESSSSWDLEICGAAFRPLPMVLNRQLIKILEDLEIPTQVFLDLQKETMDKLRCMTDSAVNTATLLEGIESTKATKVPSLINLLNEIGLDYRQDHFLYRIVEMALANHLREIKYRGRIPIEQGFTLYGIMDETGFLQEGEVYVATQAGPNGGRDDRPREKIVVTRSPAMHPGDVQIVNAVAVPHDSPLKRLSNVIVFSQHGDRDLPSQLSGGDLDGDLYNVIFDRRLIPEFTYCAAEYARVEPVELNRPVTSQDMSDFFVRFMETDQLGMLCNVHMQIADQKDSGTLSPECLKLAAMASTAVDYSKTGIGVDIKQIPRYDHCRPDFMAPSPRVFITKQGYMDFEDEEYVDDDAFEGMDLEKKPYRYYESQKALGHLFRAIDERRFIHSMQRERQLLMDSEVAPVTRRLLDRLFAYVKQYAHNWGLLWEHHLDLGRDIKLSYEESVADLAYQFEPTARSPLSEGEVFAGSILGRQGGQQGKGLREMSKSMRERFETVVEYATARITHGDVAVQEADDLDDLSDQVRHERDFEALPRAIACLYVAVTERGYSDRLIGEMKSFGYVAAGVALREMLRFRITTFGSYVLPRMTEEAGTTPVSCRN